MLYKMTERTQMSRKNGTMFTNHKKGAVLVALQTTKEPLMHFILIYMLSVLRLHVVRDFYMLTKL